MRQLMLHEIIGQILLTKPPSLSEETLILTRNEDLGSIRYLDRWKLFVLQEAFLIHFGEGNHVAAVIGC